LPRRVVREELDEMRVEPLFREHMPDLFTRHGHLQALGDAMLAADGDEARGKAIARLFEAVLMLWLRGQVSAPGVEPWLEFRGRVRRVLAAMRVQGKSQRIAAFTSAGPVASPVPPPLSTDDDNPMSLALRLRHTSVSEVLL